MSADQFKCGPSFLVYCAVDHVTGSLQIKFAISWNGFIDKYYKRWDNKGNRRVTTNHVMLW